MQYIKNNTNIFLWHSPKLTVALQHKAFKVSTYDGESPKYHVSAWRATCYHRVSTKIHTDSIPYKMLSLSKVMTYSHRHVKSYRLNCKNKFENFNSIWYLFVHVYNSNDGHFHLKFHTIFSEFKKEKDKL